jgi:hypothetical protein
MTRKKPARITGINTNYEFYCIIIIIIIIIMRSSSDSGDNNNRHYYYVIQRIAGFAITLKKSRQLVIISSINPAEFRILLFSYLL